MTVSLTPPVTISASVALAIGLLAGCSTPVAEPTDTPVASPSAAEPTPSVAPSTAEPTPSVDPAEVAAARENLAASISSGNTAALASWVTDPIRVTIAASEFSELLSPFEAAAQADYVVDLAATWDFALPDATIDHYRAGDYSGYFPDDVLVGRSSTGAVVAFAMTGARASAMFLCIDEQLLLF